MLARLVVQGTNDLAEGALADHLEDLVAVRDVVVQHLVVRAVVVVESAILGRAILAVDFGRLVAEVPNLGVALNLLALVLGQPRAVVLDGLCNTRDKVTHVVSSEPCTGHHRFNYLRAGESGRVRPNGSCRGGELAGLSDTLLLLWWWLLLMLLLGVRLPLLLLLLRLGEDGDPVELAEPSAEPALFRAGSLWFCNRSSRATRPSVPPLPCHVRLKLSNGPEQSRVSQRVSS